jgi:hypothetical protein
MSQKTLPLDYANDLMFEMQKAFFDERGKGARFRMTTVGRGFYQENVRPLLKSTDVANMLKVIKEVLVSKGIVTEVSYLQEERLFRVKVTGCIHRSVEDRMLEKGIEPFTCIPANLIVLALEEKLEKPVELAEIKVEDGVCNLLLVLFDKRPVLE